jgi:uncharacterized protein
MSLQFRKLFTISCTICVLTLLSTQSADAATISIDPPGSHEFIVDKGYEINDEDETTIQEICDKLLSDKGTRMVVVTITSMADFGQRGARIESYAARLYDQWGKRQKGSWGDKWKKGILLLVSIEDRKARIELGSNWKHEKNRQCRTIMSDQIVYHFKRGNYSKGITAGVIALDKMARDQALPGKQRPLWHFILAGFIIVFFFGSIISAIHSGSKGWGWFFWATIFGTIGAILHQLAESSSSDDNDSWFDGSDWSSCDSFDGGFSGGGGATGSW